MTRARHSPRSGIDALVKNGVRPPFIGPTPAVVASRYLKLPVHRRRVLVAAMTPEFAEVLISLFGEDFRPLLESAAAATPDQVRD